MFRLIVILVSTIFLSCSITMPLGKLKPDEPYKGPIPKPIERLQELNPILAQNLLQIPDIKDGLEPDEIEGLDRLLSSYESMPDKFALVINDLDNKGNKSHVPYDTGIEAIFWIYKDNKRIADAEYIIEDYNKRVLPSRHQMAAGINLEGLLKIAWNFYDDSRWGNTEQVYKRLNAPEYISYFTSAAVHYEHSKHVKDLWEILKSRTGDCEDVTKLSVALLKMAGYKAKPICVPGYTMGVHFITAYLVNGKWYVQDNGRPNPTGILGPYDKIGDIPYKNMGLPQWY